MTDKTLYRNESTPEGRRIWEMVARVAARAPQWVKDFAAKQEKDNAAEPTEEEAW